MRYRITVCLFLLLPVFFPFSNAFSDDPVKSSEIEEFWESVRDLSEVISDGTEAVKVSFLEEDLKDVPFWQEEITFSLQIQGVNDMAAFDMAFEYSPRFEILDEDFVKPGPLWLQFSKQFPLIGVSSKEANIAQVLGGSPRTPAGEGITADSGILAEITLRISSPGSGFARIKDFYWTKAGGDLMRRRADVVGTTTVQVIQEKKRAFLAFSEPEEEVALRDGSHIKKAKKGDLVRVCLCGENFSRVTGLRFDVTFDREGLTLLSIDPGNLFRREGRTLSCFDPVGRLNRDGRVFDQGIALLDPSEGSRGGGTIATMLFLVGDSPPAQIRLNRVVSVRPGLEPREEEIEIYRPKIPLVVEIE